MKKYEPQQVCQPEKGTRRKGQSGFWNFMDDSLIGPINFIDPILNRITYGAIGRKPIIITLPRVDNGEGSHTREEVIQHLKRHGIKNVRLGQHRAEHTSIVVRDTQESWVRWLLGDVENGGSMNYPESRWGDKRFALGKKSQKPYQMKRKRYRPRRKKK
jgi:hypothetical protein